MKTVQPSTGPLLSSPRRTCAADAPVRRRAIFCGMRFAAVAERDPGRQALQETIVLVTYFESGEEMPAIQVQSFEKQVTGDPLLGGAWVGLVDEEAHASAIGGTPSASKQRGQRSTSAYLLATLNNESKATRSCSHRGCVPFRTTSSRPTTWWMCYRRCRT